MYTLDNPFIDRAVLVLVKFWLSLFDVETKILRGPKILWQLVRRGSVGGTRGEQDCGRLHSVMYSPNSCTNFSNTMDHKMHDVSVFSETTDWGQGI